MKRKGPLWLIVAIAVIALAFYLWGSSHTPPGQPPLVSLDQANVAQFQEGFNAANSETRIVLLLSPT